MAITEDRIATIEQAITDIRNTLDVLVPKIQFNQAILALEGDIQQLNDRLTSLEAQVQVLQDIINP